MIDDARRIADELLFPLAHEVDRGHIPASHFTALSDAGLFSIDHLSPAQARRVVATIGGGCGATFFVWVQHHGVVRALAGSSNDALRSAVEKSVRAGDIIGGTAFAHVRRNGSPAIRATPTDAGWRLDGGAPWATSWGIAGRFSVAAETDDGRIVWVMLPGDGGPGVSARPIELPVFAATGTVVLHFDGCQVTADDVISVDNADTWRAADRRRAAIGQPAVLGVADRAVRLLAESDRGPRGDAARAAQHLREELERVWTADDELTTAMIDGHDAIAEASHHRARCLAFAQRCTTALLAAAGGAGMDLRHPAQRLAREATFYVIQAQTSDGRAATLEYQLGSDTR